MSSFEAILFPSDGRLPHMVSLTTSPTTMSAHHSSFTLSPLRMPHPEEFMDYIAKGLGSRAWRYQLVEALDGMHRKFTHPYIIFYPTVSQDGLPFPINNLLCEIQGPLFREEVAWRGNIIIAKYRDEPFSSMTNVSIADFPILKNYLMTHGSPVYC
ncbi:hypothetical protein PTI98_011436 [Pleurotus ostreatus]|uniref:Uncharacterized protein n=1 Tax=Pleurotus cornucopiae TaxID=5321 RepID=A0ACB7JB68_PLECO|nr:hypothetical protein CCMSSC00406_0008671 [Pleurotus cornucopiae]KAJ8691917.1 hypothetical protein PTI98_011436 [Pleurotus ostreatus]